MADTEAITFSLEGREYVELNNLLKLTGLCNSGGEAKMFIADGLVTVNGEIELRKRCKIRNGSLVDFQDSSIQVIE